MTRILYCESNVDGTVGGSHHCLLSLVRHLDRSRFQPTVIFYDRHALVPKFEAVTETLVLDKDVPSQLSFGLARRAVNAAKLAGKVASQVAFLKRRRIDLLHLNNSITRHHEWMLAARLAGVPCIVHERGLPQYGAADRALGRRLAAIIPVSQWVARAMVEQGVDADNIRVMYDGFTPDGAETTPTEGLRAQWQVAPSQPVVGIVGNVRHWKGQETVARALEEVVRTHPDVVCFFVGATTPQDRPYLEQIQSRLAAAGLERNVRFTGFQDNVAAYIAMMSIVLHASVEAEPFGMVVLEAMARKKPVIGSRAGGVVEMVIEGETGYTVPPGDPSAMAARITELLSDPSRARQMGERGYQRLLRDFSVEQYMAGVHATYEAVLSGGPLPAGVPMTQARLA